MLALTPAVTLWDEGKHPGHIHRHTTYSHTLDDEQLKGSSQANVHVFGRWEETGVPGESQFGCWETTLTPHWMTSHMSTKYMFSVKSVFDN